MTFVYVTAPGGTQYIIQAAATGQIIQASQPTAVTTSAIPTAAHPSTTEQQQVRHSSQVPYYYTDLEI